MKFAGLPGLALYLGIGALFHAVMVGPQFDWVSAWTWGWLLGWPIMIFVAFWAATLGIAVIGILAAILLAVLDSDVVSRWRTNRLLRKVAKRRTANQ
jgi:hypothetical protein